MSDNDFDFGVDEKAEEKKEEIFPSIFKADLLIKGINEIPMCNLGSLKILKFKCEASEDYIAGSMFTLCKIPPSEVRILGALSNITASFPIEGHLGWAKYRNRNRQIIDRDEKGFDAMFASELKTMKIDSLEGVYMVFTTNQPGDKGDFIEGYIVYVKM